MQLDHKCSQDCETLHKEIFKKIMLIIFNGRTNQPTNQTSCTSNNWFGLEIPLISKTAELLQENEEVIKGFLSGKLEKNIEILIYLDNEEGIIGIDDIEDSKHLKGLVRKGGILLERWQIKFQPRIIEEGEIRKLYKRTSLFVRSLLTISRLLPCYPILQDRFPIKIEIKTDNFDSDFYTNKLGESLIDSELTKQPKAFEVVNKTELSKLQTNHGDLEIIIQFKKLSGCKFYTISRSPAIRVPQQVIKAKDIQIKSSPAGSGDWVDMAQQNMNSNSMKKHSRQPSGQVKILTTAHKLTPATSSLSTETQKTKPSLTEFIKLFEKVPETGNSSPAMRSEQMIQVIEAGRSKKIHFDRWLEELEIEQETFQSGAFDLINNME